MSWISRFRITLPRAVLRVTYGVSLISLSIRDFLFGNGLYIFRDWTWPLSNSLPPIATFSPEIVRNVGPDPLGFVRMFVTWPILLIDYLTSDPILAEKIYVVYFFALFAALFFVYGELLLRLLSKISGDAISPWKREAFVLMVVLLCFVNFWSIQQLSDLYFTATLEFCLIAISATILLLRNRVRDAFLPGALIALCIFLDPNLYPYGLLVVATCVLATSLGHSLSLKKFQLAMTRILVVIAVTIPALVTMLYTFSISTGTNLRPAGFYLQSASNLSLANAARLLGYSWSLIAYAPPTVLTRTYDISSLDSLGAPAYLLLPGGALTIFWLVTTWTVPVFAFGTNMISRFRKLTLPISCVAIAGLLFTQPSILPYPFEIATQLRDTPLVGGALVTFLAIPDHALVVVAIAYTMLISTGVYYLLSRDVLSNLTRLVRLPIIPNVLRAKYPRIRPTIPLLMLTLLLVFQGWQFFSGSFYPSGYVWGNSGNGVSSVGAFTPSKPPSEMVEIYNWLYSQPDNFNIYWPGPSGSNYSWSPKATGSIASQDSPKPTVFPRALPYLLSSGLTADISDYLASLNVKYVVVQPFSKTAMQLWWGVTDVKTLNQILAKTPGLGVAKEVGEIIVYRVGHTWGTMYSSPIVASYDPTDLRYAIAYNLFSSIGTRISLTTLATAPSRLCIDNMACPYAIISPGELGFADSYAKSVRLLNDTSVTWESFRLNSNTNRLLPSPWNPWLVTNWGPANASVGIQDGSMVWTFNETHSSLSLSYNGTVTGGNPGGITVPFGSVAAVHAGFWYRTSNTFDGIVQIVIPQLANTTSWIKDSASPAMPPSAEWKYVSFNDTLTFNTAYFTTRFAAQASAGWVEIRDVQMNFLFTQQDPQSAFAYTLPLQNKNLDLAPNLGYSYVEFDGTGSLNLNGQTFGLTSPNKASWYSLPSPSNSMTVLSGVNLHALMVSKSPLSVLLDDPTLDGGWTPSMTVQLGSAVVFTRPFALGYSLHSSLSSYSSHPTLDGVNLFLAVNPGRYRVALEGTTMAQVAYFASLGLILGIIISAGFSRLNSFAIVQKILRKKLNLLASDRGDL